jgi:hypothetical protein
MKLKKAGAFTITTNPIRIEKERIEKERIEKERIEKEINTIITNLSKGISKNEDILVQAELEIINKDKVIINKLTINSKELPLIQIEEHHFNLNNTIKLLIGIINNISNKSA